MCRCEYGEPRWKVHHNLRGLLLPLLLQDESSYSGGQESWQGNKRFIASLLQTCFDSTGYNAHQVLDNCIEAEKLVGRYEALASDLLDWIEKTIAVIGNQKFANSLSGVQQQLQAFTTYCTVEKPIKWVEWIPFPQFTSLKGAYYLKMTF